MEREPKEGEKEEAQDWLLRAKEGKDIKILNPKDERKERRAAGKKTKKLLDDFGQKELFPENR